MIKRKTKTRSKTRSKARSKSRRLPQPSGNMHITDFGYKLNNNTDTRRRALQLAIRKHGSLTVMKHINLIRNLTDIPKNRKKLSDDVEYLKNVYSRDKKRKNRSKTRSKTRSRRI